MVNQKAYNFVFRAKIPFRSLILERLRCVKLISVTYFPTISQNLGKFEKYAVKFAK